MQEGGKGEKEGREGGKVGGNDFWEKEPQQLLARQVISMCESERPFWIVRSLQNH